MRLSQFVLFAVWAVAIALAWWSFYRDLPRQEWRMGPCGRRGGGVFHEVVKTRRFALGPARVTCYHPRGFDHLEIGRPAQHGHSALADSGLLLSYVSSAAVDRDGYVGLHAHPTVQGSARLEVAFAGTEWEHFHDESGHAVFHERLSA